MRCEVVSFSAGIQVSDSYGQHLETYTERMKGAVIEEPFMYTDCFDNSANFLPPLSYVTKVQLELVCTTNVTAVATSTTASASTTTTTTTIAFFCFCFCPS